MISDRFLDDFLFSSFTGSRFVIKKVRSEDFSPSLVRTKVLTTNFSDRERSIEHDMTTFSISFLSMGSPARSTRKLNFCGTGILPVIENDPRSEE
jgi:hypothetical protein